MLRRLRVVRVKLNNQFGETKGVALRAPPFFLDQTSPLYIHFNKKTALKEERFD